MKRTILYLSMFLLTLTGAAKTMTVEEMQANAEFLEAHPAVAKIAQSTYGNSGLPTFTLPGGTALPKSYSPAYAAALPHIVANMVGNSSWTGRYSAYGVYDFQPGAGFVPTAIKTDIRDTMYGNGGAVMIGNRYYLMRWAASLGSIVTYYYVWNTDTWELINSVESFQGNLCCTDVAYDRLSGKVYGACFNDNLSGYELAEMHYTDRGLTKTTIGALPLMVTCLAVDSKGELYAVCEDGVLYKVDSSTAKMTMVGDTGVKVAGNNGIVQQSAAFDQHTDVMYWASHDVYGNNRLYQVNPTDASITLVTDIADNMRLINLQVLAPSAADKAPNYLTDFTVDYPIGRQSGSVSFTMPADTYDGSTLDGDLTYKIAFNGEVVEEGTGKPGDKISKEITVAGGETTIEAWAENEAGASPVESVSLWIGQDVPYLTSVDFKADGNKAIIIWKTAAVGTHGGAVDNLTYDIVRLPDNKEVATGVTGDSYTDDIPENSPANYSYKVTPINGELRGEPMTSNPLLVGGAVSLPYKNTFDNQSSFDMLTIVDSNNDKETWKWAKENNASDNGVARLTDSSWSEAGVAHNDWLLTPAIQLKEGYTYKVTFKAMSNADGAKLTIAYGQGDNVDLYRSVDSPAKLDDWYLTEYETTITSDKDQLVRIGFHGESTYTMGKFMIDDLEISEGQSDKSPAAVTDLEVIPDSKGELSAEVSFVTPSVDKAGDKLDNLTKIEIWYDNTLAKTLANPSIGEAYTITVAVPASGFRDFRVVTFNEDGQGDSAKARIYVGEDVPGYFSVRLYDMEDRIRINWDAPTVGLYGNFINPDNVTYRIYNVYGDYDLMDCIAQGLTGTELLAGYACDEGEQGKVKLAMVGENKSGVGAVNYSNSLIVGKPYELPYEDHFTQEAEYLYDIDYNDTFFNYAGGQSSDGDGQSICWVILKDASPYKELGTLKISLNGAEHPVASMDIKITSAGGVVELIAVTPDGERHTLKTVSGSEYDNKYGRVSVDLSEYKDERYIRLVMHLTNPEENNGIISIDNLNIMDSIDRDLALEMTVTPTAAKIGKNVPVELTVKNRGQLTAEKYFVSLYANGILSETKEGTPLNSLDNTRLTFFYDVQPKDSEGIAFDAIVEYDGDANEDNNEASGEVQVVSKVSVPQTVTGVDSNGVTIDWKAPTEFYSEDVVEDFESYTPWTITMFGEWTVRDLDGAPTIDINVADFPNLGKPQAFTVFNPTSIGMPDANTEGIPHSGAQYLVCIASDVMKAEHNDDWLISPILPGTAQTVKFWAKEMISYFGPEKLQALYSTTGPDTEDFILVKEYDIDNPYDWKEYSFDVPEGTLYFALRVVTSDGHIFMLDDISFTAGSCTDITGYNVYCDDTLIGSVSADTNSFEDPKGNGKMRYNVTALYATGEESAYSLDAEFDPSGIESISSETLYDVYSVDGRIINLRADSLNGLEPGVYIVNGKKVMIKR